ncbi:MAG: hypothetical protein AMXMBFR59_34290 [Rhodanobacteraceae bacterium]
MGMGFRRNPERRPRPSPSNHSMPTTSLMHLRRITVAIAIAAALVTAAANAASPSTAPESTATPRAADASENEKRNGAAIYLADLPLIDQHGKPVDLYKDYIAGRRIVLHSFFTRCEGSCPVMMTTLQALQKQLGPRLGKDVHIVSITVDPDHDTPHVMADYARRVQAKPGWHFLSGSNAQVTAALRRIGQYTDAPENHMNLIIVGNDVSGDWRKVHGLAGVKQVVTEILEAVGVEG